MKNTVAKQLTISALIVLGLTAASLTLGAKNADARMCWSCDGTVCCMV